MYVQDCKLSELIPPHAVKVPSHRDEIAASMQADGWSGRPLLGWWDESQDVVFLLTGSHRYAAAGLAGLDEVPVALVELPEGVLSADGERLVYDGYSVHDFDALLPVLEAEDPDAAALLKADL